VYRAGMGDQGGRASWYRYRGRGDGRQME
jgi:hypothetical protein